MPTNHPVRRPDNEEDEHEPSDGSAIIGDRVDQDRPEAVIAGRASRRCSRLISFGDFGTKAASRFWRGSLVRSTRRASLDDDAGRSALPPSAKQPPAAGRRSCRATADVAVPVDRATDANSSEQAQMVSLRHALLSTRC